MDKLKKIKKEDWWGIIMIVLLLINLAFFVDNIRTGNNYILNYIATTTCSFSLGLWLGSGSHD